MRITHGQMFRMHKRFGRFWGLFWGFAVLSLIFWLGVAAFMIVEGWNLADSMYMVVITLSTVGFTEIHPLSPHGRAVTMLLILSGVGTFFYLIGSFTQMLVEGTLQTYLGSRKVRKQIDKMSGHVIVCGYGRIGKVVVEDFLHENVSVVVVEKDPETAAHLAEQDIPHIVGDATDDGVLKAAGIERARAVATVLTQEAVNVYVTLNARQLNPDVTIVARADDRRHIQLLERAGANQALIPHLYGGRRIAQMVLRPTALNLVEIAFRGDTLDLRIEEFRVDPGSALDGKSVLQSGIRSKYNCIIIAIAKADGDAIFNPGPETVIEAGDLLILVGSHENFLALEASRA